jgi:hypothetical protein
LEYQGTVQFSDGLSFLKRLSRILLQAWKFLLTCYQLWTSFWSPSSPSFPCHCHSHSSPSLCWFDA